jgi:hypothetical protein
VNIIEHCNKHLEELYLIKKINSLNIKHQKIINNTIKYDEHMNDKDYYTLYYFIKNYNIIFLDKNILRKMIRIAKRVLGLLVYKLRK